MGKFHLVTAVWGKRFLDRYMATTLPTILSKNNIPGFSQANDVEYFIYTTLQDQEYLVTSSLIIELKKYIPLHIVTNHYHPEKAKYDRVTSMYLAALKNSIEQKAGTIFLPPDGIWSDGTLVRISELAAEGYRAVLSADGLRVVKEDFMSLFEREFPRSDSGSISVSARKLMKLAISCLHPYEASIMWSAPVMHDVPFRLHWPVKGEGMVTRGFHVLPIFIHPETEVDGWVGALDHGLVEVAINDPTKIYYCYGTDEFAVVSIDELGFSAANYKATGKNQRILKIAKWAYRNATPQNLEAAKRPFRRNFVEPTEMLWNRVERISQKNIYAVLSCRKLLAISDAMVDHGANKAAAVLSYALNNLGITRWLKEPFPQTIIAPSDKAFTKTFESNVDMLLQTSERKRFLRQFFRYVIVGIRSADEISKDFGVTVEVGDIDVEDWRLHIIDSVLNY